MWVIKETNICGIKSCIFFFFGIRSDNPICSALLVPYIPLHTLTIQTCLHKYGSLNLGRRCCTQNLNNYFFVSSYEMCKEGDLFYLS